MPKNLTDDPSIFPTQTSPLAGEPRTAGSVETPFQNAANRAAWLRDRLDNIDPTREGARRLRRFASIATLRASGDYPDKTIAQVDGVGIYQFDALSTATAAEPFVVTPTAVGVGAGRWIWSAFGSLNVANGIPQLDGTGLLPTARLAGADGTKIRANSVRNGLVAAPFSVSDGGSTTSTTLAAVPGASVSFSAEAADIVRVFAAFTTYGATNEMLHNVVLWSGAPVLSTTGRIATTGPGTPFVQVCLAERFSVPSNGAYEVRLQHALNLAATGTGWTTNIRLHVDVIRP